MDKAVFFDKKYLLINWNKTWFDFFWVFFRLHFFWKKNKGLNVWYSSGKKSKKSIKLCFSFIVAYLTTLLDKSGDKQKRIWMHHLNNN